MSGYRHKLLEKIPQSFLSRQSLQPVWRDGFGAIKHSSEASGDAAGRVGVIAEIHSFEDAFSEGIRCEQAPDRSDESV